MNSCNFPSCFFWRCSVEKNENEKFHNKKQKKNSPIMKYNYFDKMINNI